LGVAVVAGYAPRALWLVLASAVGIGFVAGAFPVLALGAIAIRPALGGTAPQELAEASSQVDIATIFGAGILLASAIWLLARWRQRGLRLSVFAISGGVYVTVITLGSLSSAYPRVSVFGTAKLASVVVLLAALEQLVAEDSQRWVTRILIAVMGSSVLPATYGVAQLLGGVDNAAQFDVNRIVGTFVHPNIYAKHLVLMILLGMALLAHVAPRLRLALGAYLGLLCVLLLATYSRTAWLGLFAGLIVLGVAQYPLILRLLPVALAVAVLAVPQLGQRFADVRDVPVTEPGRPPNTLSWRVNYWGDVLPLASGHELAGIGFDVTQQLLWERMPPHNEFLRSYVETGIVGALAFGGWLLSGAIAAIAAVRSRREGIACGVAVAFAASGAALLAMLVTENVLGEIENLWTLAALAAAAQLRRGPTLNQTLG
jgi:O-antigen ligase